jgi:hypothetical protein
MASLHVVISAGFLISAAVAAQPLPEAPGSTIGYATVAAALKSLSARPDVHLNVQGGWTVADDRVNSTLWSFAPEGNPAYPAAVKRQIKEAKDGIYIETNILCEASKTACDKLVVDFQKLNEAIKQGLSRPR